MLPVSATPQIALALSKTTYDRALSGFKQCVVGLLL